MKVIRKVTARLQDIRKAVISAELSAPSASRIGDDASSPDRGAELQPNGSAKVAPQHVANALETDAGKTDGETAFKEKQREMIQSLDLSKYVYLVLSLTSPSHCLSDFLCLNRARYAIDDDGVDWTAAESQVAKIGKAGAGAKSSVISLKTTAEAVDKKRKADDSREARREHDKKKDA